MNSKGSTLRGSWLPRFGWGKRKVRNGDDDVNHIPTQVALGKVSRSVIDDDLTLESGDVFTHVKSSESDEKPFDLNATPCRLREIDDVAESAPDLNERESPTSSSPGCLKTEQRNKATSRKAQETSEKKVQKSTVPIVAAADATTIALSVWACW
ncbi:hypothetical protein FisN_3Lu560 [Fistulifera solaris]|uniref:Uncharacterized protein n=1 Tax=Fistulifera solaris TaxID=1519565 RepID=A0A1Z5J9C6_FISSO|nr:hypothetical protein FisN_3Lu560 [Fistulifera solaris]|eukprot:GAX10351.1 hypothetical protein FisN_3Lu560 [Fistulifera solaris]